MWEGGPGSVLAVVLDTAPAPTLFFGLGARGKPAERVADEAVDQAIAYLDARRRRWSISHSADQIVLPLALAEGPSEYRVAEVTPHLTTNIARDPPVPGARHRVRGRRGRAGPSADRLIGEGPP